jgi:hypothetical protein
MVLSVEMIGWPVVVCGNRNIQLRGMLDSLAPGDVVTEARSPYPD